MRELTLKSHERASLRIVLILVVMKSASPAAISKSFINSASSSNSSSDSEPQPSYDRAAKLSASQTNWLVGEVKPKTWMIDDRSSRKPSKITALSGIDLQPNLPLYPPYPPNLPIYPPYPPATEEQHPEDTPEDVDGGPPAASVAAEEAGTVQAQIECPEKNGLQAYAHPEECDQFYLCTNGTLTLERCQNGLLFKGGPGAVHNHCHYHWDVDCSVRHKDMVALSTESCEYQFGMYPEGVEEGGCSNKYLVCEFGRANVAECAAGLAYDPRTHRCNWPDEMMDLKCEPKNLLGFECPEGIPEDPVSARFWPYPRFALKGDCQRLITCVNGQPRLITCDADMVVDDTTLTCEEPELVPNCAHFAKQNVEENNEKK